VKHTITGGGGAAIAPPGATAAARLLATHDLWRERRMPLAAAALAAALPVGLILVFAGFTVARVAALFGPPVVVLPCGACGADAVAPAKPGSVKQA
jgi:hypothetical protein